MAETITLGPEKLMKYHIYVNEQCMKISSQRVVLFDMEGMSRHHLDRRGLAILKQFIEIDQRHYPETLHKLYIVNAPRLLWVGYKIVEPWLDPATAAKVEILGANYQAILREKIGVENLPESLGGKCRCEGGCVPEAKKPEPGPGWFGR